jgi:hypothetical protein
MVINAIVSIVAILALSFIQWQLLAHGIDGTIALLIIAAIAGIAGYNVQKILSFLTSKNNKGG